MQRLGKERTKITNGKKLGGTTTQLTNCCRIFKDAVLSRKGKGKKWLNRSSIKESEQTTSQQSVNQSLRLLEPIFCIRQLCEAKQTASTMERKKNFTDSNPYAVLNENKLTIQDSDGNEGVERRDEVLPELNPSKDSTLVLVGTDEEAPLSSTIESLNESALSSLKNKDQKVNDEELLSALATKLPFTENSLKDSRSLVLARTSSREVKESMQSIYNNKVDGNIRKIQNDVSLEESIKSTVNINEDFNKVVEESIVVEDYISLNEGDRKKYPNDCYSFLALYGPIDDPYFFFFGLMPLFFSDDISGLADLQYSQQTSKRCRG